MNQLFLILAQSASEIAKKAEKATEQNMSQKLAAMSNMSLEEFLKKATSWSIELCIKIVIALIIYQIGRWVIHRIKRAALKAMERREVELSLKNFLLSLVQISLMVVLVGIVIVILGVSTTSIVAILASASLGVGMAMSGTLQNIAGGVIILFQKPYKIGDVIDVQNHVGTVKEIRLFHTVINTIDNKSIFLPNGSTSSGVIINITNEHWRRIEWIISIAYGDNFNLARDVMQEIIDAEERIDRSEGHEPLIAIKSLANSSVDIVVRAWVETDQYWNVYFEINNKVYSTFPERGLNFPFPQMDVHLKS